MSEICRSCDFIESRTINFLGGTISKCYTLTVGMSVISQLKDFFIGFDLKRSQFCKEPTKFIFRYSSSYLIFKDSFKISCKSWLFLFFWQVTLGNRRGLSKIDILQMKLLYKCSGGGGGPNPPPPTNKPPGLCICTAQGRKICLHYFFKFAIYLYITLTFHGTFQQEPQFPVVCLCMTHSWQRNHLEFFFFF